MSEPVSDVALYRAVGEGGELSMLDKELLKLAAKRLSPEEIVKEGGLSAVLTPARAAQRIREILHSQDFLSLTEQKSLLLLDFVDLRDKLWERIDGTETRLTKHGDTIEVDSDPRHITNLIRLLKEWRGLVESMQTDIDSDSIKIRDAHASIMMAAMSVMFDRFLGKLEAAGYGVPKAQAMEMWEEVMPLGFASLEKRTES
jgi:hypothetical protein